MVRCSVDASFLDEATPVPPDSRTLLSIGRLSAQKGQFLLVDAMAELVAEDVDVRLILAGDGELRDALQRRIDEARLGEHVHITGWVLQFIGHGVFEGRAPALLDSLDQALITAPLFVLLEVRKSIERGIWIRSWADIIYQPVTIRTLLRRQ